jgi:hypothetical protein
MAHPEAPVQVLKITGLGRSGSTVLDVVLSNHPKNHEGRPMWKTAVRWTVPNLASGWVCARLGPGRAMRLRYEDFVADPEAALGRIGSLIGLDLAGVADAASSGEPLRVGHNIGGNRTKKSGYVTLRPDGREWEGALSPAEQRLAWALLGWLMRRYGYGR